MIQQIIQLIPPTIFILDLRSSCGDERDVTKL